MAKAERQSSTKRPRRAQLQRASKAKSPAPKASLDLPTPDQIFAVIATHREANKDYAAKLKAAEADGSKSSEKAAAVAGLRALGARFHLFTTPPTTLVGIACLLEYVALPEYGRTDPSIITNGFSFSGTVGEAARQFPAHVAAAVRGLIGGRS
jgi:hypothetical protein